jgi:hypothetical protein
MTYGQHCVAVELDERQAKVLQERVIALEVKEEPDLAKRQPKDFFGHLVTRPSLVPLEQRLVESKSQKMRERWLAHKRLLEHLLAVARMRRGLRRRLGYKKRVI